MSTKKKTSLTKHANQIKKQALRKKCESNSLKDLAKLLEKSCIINVENKSNDAYEVRTNKKGNVLLQHHSTDKRQFAEVGCDVGMTKNLGNFNSVKVSVNLKVPVEITGLQDKAKLDKLSKSQDFIVNFCTKKLEKVLNDEEGRLT